MDRYVAMVWDANREDASASAKGLTHEFATRHPAWNCSLSRPGLVVYHARSRSRQPAVRLFSDDLGLVIGHVFEEHGAASAPDRFMAPEETRRVIRSRGRYLCERLWGQYVAIFVDPTNGYTSICRDPAGGLPCFMTEFRGVFILFASAVDLPQPVRLSLSVNWRHVAAYVLFVFLKVRQTGLNEVSEILPGESVQIQGSDTQRQFIWDARDEQSRTFTGDVREAGDAVRRRTVECVGAWASSYTNVLHDLSGGLDSAVVAACLCISKPPARIRCLHFCSERAEGNEVDYARLSANKSGLELIELALQSGSTGIRHAFDVPPLTNPSSYIVGRLSNDDAHVAIARKIGADASFSGQGGDQLFYQNATRMVAADFLRLHGLRSGLFSTLQDTARLTRDSFWLVLRSAIQYGLLKKRSSPYAELHGLRSLLTDDARDALKPEDFLHPWLLDSKDTPPGKMEQIASIVSFQSHYIPFGRIDHMDVIYPLFSQPLLELCLRIPTYVLTRGGIDRALERRAFCLDIPSEIVERQTKADITNYYSRILVRDLPFVRQVLLEGELARNGVVDRAQVEKQLSAERLVRGERIADVVACVGVEAWAQAWLRPAREAAA